MDSTEFKSYMSSKFAADVVQTLICKNLIYEDYIKSNDGLYEGTIRAAVWSVLRNNLPKSWFIQAECEYPEEKSINFADIVVWSPEQIPYVMEVKPFIGIDKINSDIKKLDGYISRNEKRYAFMIYVTLYGRWKIMNDPNKKWKECNYCYENYKEIGKCMPWGYGDCINCGFAKDTVNHLDRKNNIEVIPLYIEVN